MLYILDQRLRAQSIPDEKARKGKQEKFSRRPQKWALLNMASTKIISMASVLTNKYTFSVDIRRKIRKIR